MPKQHVTDEMKANACKRLEDRFRQLGHTISAITILRVGSGSRPHVARASIDGKQGIIKDHNGCDPLFAYLLGKLLARREVRTLKKLEGLNGVPLVIKVFDSRAFMMTDLEAVPFRASSLSKNDWDMYFKKLRNLIHSIHQRDIAHCDLRSLDNTLVTKTGDPAIVDFVGSFRNGQRWNFLSKWIFQRLCNVDISAISKQKKAVAPWLLLHDEYLEKHHETIFSRTARNTGVFIRKLTRLLFTR